MIKKNTKKASIASFDFSDVPSWYALCTNSGCPMCGDCLRYLAASYAPETKETAYCVMPSVMKGEKCRWLDRKSVVLHALGFSKLFDHVKKCDFTRMRKMLTDYLHGNKMYYQYMRGERPLSPAQQQWIRDFMASQGYPDDVVFDGYKEVYVFRFQKSAS